MEKLHLSYEVELADSLRRCEQLNRDCKKCPEYLDGESCAVLSDAALELERLYLSIQNYGLKNAELEIKLSLERFRRDRLQQQIESIQKDFRQLVARINSGEDLMACDYCRKNFGECNCNCLKDFEWYGNDGIEQEQNNDG